MNNAAKTLALTVLLTACAESGEPEAYVYGDVEIRPIDDSLEIIAGWLEKRLRPDFEALQPGIGREEVDAAVADLGLDLPEEVYRLYAWRNGQRGEDPQLFPGYRFLPIEEASGARRVIRGGGFWSETWDARSAYRYGMGPGSGFRGRGFRVCLPAVPERS